MASPEQIAEVRENTGLPLNEEPWTDERIGDIIDAAGSVERASAVIWSKLAGTYAKSVDVTEAGASHKFSDLHKHALDMSAYWEGVADGSEGDVEGRAKVHVIERESLVNPLEQPQVW